MKEAEQKIAEMMERARKAQEKIAEYDQDEVDELVKAVAIECMKDENAMENAKLAVEEGEMGKVDDKYKKILAKVKGAYNDIKDMNTVGKIDEDKETGISKFAKPVGVVGGLIPSTNCEATPPIKGLFTIKGRNAIIMAPHPKTKRTSCMMADLMRKALKEKGAPADIIQCIEEPSLELANELMKQCDLIVATGGTSMVKAAYSSGTPAFGVGQGNATVIVDETADIESAAEMVRKSKTFDYATSCSTENSLVVEESIYDDFMDALQSEGGYLVNEAEKERLGNALWPDGKNLNKDIVARSHNVIADAANIELPEDKSFFIAKEENVGPNYPFSREKLAVVVAVYKYRGFENALKRLNEIISFEGLGHSCGIHSTNKEHIEALGESAKASRIMVNQPQCLANSGNWFNGMPFTLSLGCGTWGGNITTENIRMKHFLNVSWLAERIEPNEPSNKELFGQEIN
ncbi:MAG: aldehyde dehydrogenase family protein [Halanaerobiales bacterium]|nr:aldehyde dehydrogenase family protein [Halanaerobiales bacterium]